MMSISSQYQLIDKFEDKDEYKRLKLRFHVVLGKPEEEVWYPVKIVKVLNIYRENLFEGLLLNFLYHAVRANNVACNFSVADFPLMNLDDLITVTNFLISIDVLKLLDSNKDDFLIGFTHIKVFIDNYFDCLAVTEIELAMAVNRTSKVP